MCRYFFAEIEKNTDDDSFKVKHGLKYGYLIIWIEIFWYFDQKMLSVKEWKVSLEVVKAAKLGVCRDLITTKDH
jgi:hypothetical protein